MKMTDAEQREIAGTVADMEAVMSLLNSDGRLLCDHMFAPERKWEAVPSPEAYFWLRTSVRNFFADTEARMYQFRRFCLALHKLGRAQFSSEEIVCLRDLAPRVQEEKSHL